MKVYGSDEITLRFPDDKEQRTKHQESIGFVLRGMCGLVVACPRFKEELFKRLKAVDCGKSESWQGGDTFGIIME